MMENSVLLPNNQYIHIKSSNKNQHYIYTLHEENNTVSDRKEENRTPIELSKQSAIGKWIWKAVQEYSPKVKQEKDYKLIKQGLVDVIEIIEKNKQQESLTQKQKDTATHLEKINKGNKNFNNINFLDELEARFSEIAIEESNNTMIVAIAYLSQVIFNKPIGVIGIGDAGEGKTHIIETGLKIIPDKFIINKIKSLSLPSLFLLHEEILREDGEGFNSKLIYGGDMGSLKLLERNEEIMDVIKELQTEGEVRRYIAGEGGESLISKEIIANTTLVYSTVHPPTDEQFTTRSIVFEVSSANNRKVIDHKSKMRSRGQYYKKFKVKEEYLETFQDIVLYLREIVKKENIEIINLFSPNVESYFSKDRFKREFDNYSDLLEVIALLGTKPNDYIEHENVKYIVVTEEHFKKFTNYFGEYKESVHSSLSKSLLEFYYVLREVMEHNEIETTLYSVNELQDISEIQQLKLNRNTLRKRLKRLEERGYLKGEKDGYNWEYSFVEVEPVEEFKLELTNEMLEFVEYDHPEIYQEILEKI